MSSQIIPFSFFYYPLFGFLLEAKHIEQAQHNRYVHAFHAGVNAAEAGVILVVSLELMPGALIGFPSIMIALIFFVAITYFKVHVVRW